MKRWHMFLALLMAITLLVTLSVGCPAPAEEEEDGVVVEEEEEEEEEESILIKWTHLSATGYVRHLSTLKAVELLEEFCPGRFEVEIFPAAQLYNQVEEMEALSLGHIQAVSCWGGNPNMHVPEWDIFAIGLLGKEFDDWRHIEALKDTPEVEQYLKKPLEDIGIHFLEWACSTVGGGQFSTTERYGPIRTIEDFKGMKQHAAAGGVLSVIRAKLLGYTTLSIPIPDLPMALSTGMVDSEVGNVTFTYSMGFPVKYIHCWHTSQTDGGACQLMNLDFWNSLPQDIRDIIEYEVNPRQRAWSLQNTLKEEKETMVKMVRDRGQVFIDPDPGVFEEYLALITQPLEDWFIEEYPVAGPPLVAALKRTIPEDLR